MATRFDVLLLFDRGGWCHDRSHCPGATRNSLSSIRLDTDLEEALSDERQYQLAGAVLVRINSIRRSWPPELIILQAYLPVIDKESLSSKVHYLVIQPRFSDDEIHKCVSGRDLRFLMLI